MNPASPHESAAHHARGRAVYTDDQPRFGGMLSAWPLLAPHAHARILSCDPTAAHEVPGVVTLLTAEDVLGVNDSGHHHDEVLLPTDEVFYWGQPLLWVVAENEEAARLGAARVTVAYEPLPALLTIDAAITANSFHGKPQQMSRGDPAAVLSQAERVLEGEAFMNGQDHFYLETHASWAIPNPEGGVQVYASTQHPSETQAVVAQVLGVARSLVVVTCLRMGGGFGGKESQANPWAAIAALAARKTGRAVRVRLSREQDMVMTGKRHPFLGRYRVGFSGDGRLSALEADLYSDGGWSSDLSLPVMARAMFHIDNCYYVPHLTVRGHVCKTHKTSQTAFRGFGGPQGMLVIEEVLDRVARVLELPPDVVRARNFYRGEGESNTTHYGQEIVGNRIARVWDEALSSSDFAERRRQVAEHNASSPHSKRGLAITPVKFGISFTNTMLNQAGALMLIYADGSVQLNHGGTEMGQGLHSKMLAVAARTLGVNPARFRMMPTSTDKVPNTSATAASSGSDLNGQAVKHACDTLKARLAAVAASMLGFNAPEALTFAGDWVYSPGQPSQRLLFDDVVAQAYTEQVSLAATGFYRTPNIHFDVASGKGCPFYYYAFGAAVSEVEVDGFTGATTLKRVDIVHDVGESLNPLVDKGQVEGGFVQGMGWLTTEELVWDDEGRFMTSAPSTYKIPTIREVPEHFSVQFLARAEQPGVIYGSKAVGEPPFMLALSVREALRDAVAAFGQSDPVTLASPATPEAVLWALEAVKEASVDVRALVLGD